MKSKPEPSSSPPRRKRRPQFGARVVLPSAGGYPALPGGKRPFESDGPLLQRGTSGVMFAKSSVPRVSMMVIAKERGVRARRRRCRMLRGSIGLRAGLIAWER
jgi:hypothetical protein